MPRSWSFANDRRVIELAKASKSLEWPARVADLFLFSVLNETPIACDFADALKACAS